MTLYFVVAFQLICVLAVVLTLGAKTQDKKKKKTLGLLMGAAGVIAVGGMAGIGICLPKAMTAMLKRGLVGVEFLLYAVIVAAVLVVYKPKELNPGRIKLTGSEKRVAMFAAGVGLVSLIFMAIHNPLYIMPSDKYGYISNMYFSADIDRAVTTAVNFDFSVPTHALYRFALFPINFVILVLDYLVRKISPDSAYMVNVISGYLLCLVQIVLNSACVVLLKRMFAGLGDKCSSVGAFLFAACFSTFWVSVLPETYASALFFMLLGLYLHQQKNSFWIASAITAAGINPFTAVAFIPDLIGLIKSQKENIIRFKAKKKNVFWGCTAGAAILLCGAAVFTYKVVLVPYVGKWSDFGFFNFTKIAESISTIITPWFVGSSFDVVEPYFIQQRFSVLLICLTVVLLAMCIYGAVTKRSNKLVQNASVMLAMGVVLHIFIGYGRYNGVIYAPLYGWAAVVLLVAAMQDMKERFKIKELSYILPALAAVFMMCNSIWLFRMGTGVKKVEFQRESAKMPIEAYVAGDCYLLDGNRLIRTSDYTAVAENIDGARLYSDSISVVCNDGSSFYAEEKDGNVKVLKNLREVQEENNGGSFFIFGMGTREKYVFRETADGTYELVRYSDNAKVYDKLKCVGIFPDIYTVVAEKENREIIIYEDENGIYLKDSDITAPLDESVKINIPDFSGSEYKRELKILFNEIAVNITKDGVSPNFMAYEGSWYRDAAMMAMALDRTGNAGMMSDWISSITEIYDMQNGVPEGDNLGQLLYLQSLTDKPNQELIEAVLTEARSLQDADGALGGGRTTDGEQHRAYQTRWLKFGMESLGMDSSEFIIPQDEQDDYAEMMWFDGYGTQGCPEKTEETWNRWPYIYYAKCHMYGQQIDFTDKLSYPISKEYQPSMANFSKLSAANSRLAENKVVAPHGWTAAELLLLLYDSVE